MRLLLIDPLDSADAGLWASQHWDRIVDLGMGENKTYEHYVPGAEVRENCWSPTAPRRLRQLAAASRKPRAVVAN